MKFLLNIITFSSLIILGLGAPMEDDYFMGSIPDMSNLFIDPFKIHQEQMQRIDQEMAEMKNCNQDYNVRDIIKGVDFEYSWSTTDDEESSENCTVKFQGDESCEPEITCPKINLKCGGHEYFKLIDEEGGSQGFCGQDIDIKEPLKPKGHDLYLKYSIKNGGYHCLLKCSDGSASTLASA